MGDKARFEWGKLFARPYTIIDLCVASVSAVFGVLLLGMDVSLPHKLIGIFGILSVLLRLDSKVSYVLALVCMSNTFLFTVLSNEKPAKTFLVYGFYFLMIGVVSNVLEHQPERAIAAARNKIYAPIAKVAPWPVHEKRLRAPAVPETAFTTRDSTPVVAPLQTEKMESPTFERYRYYSYHKVQ